MSILIKGMELPKVPTLYIFMLYPDGRVDTLPYKAIHIPPHGDLIDKNILYKKTAEWEEQARHLANTAPDAQTFDKWATILTERSAFKFDVADAPTIIEAEEGETQNEL